MNNEQSHLSHSLTYTEAGATCSCGRTFSVWDSKRRSGWSAAHDFYPTRNLIRAGAERHADAQNKKGA